MWRRCGCCRSACSAPRAATTTASRALRSIRPRKCEGISFPLACPPENFSGALNHYRNRKTRRKTKIHCKSAERHGERRKNDRLPRGQGLREQSFDPGAEFGFQLPVKISAGGAGEAGVDAF